MATSHIQSFKQAYPDFAGMIQPEGKGKWGRLNIEWLQKTKLGFDKRVFSPVVNLKTGEYFGGDKRDEIAFKFALHLLATPFYVAIKTAYHALLPVSVPIIVYQTVENSKNLSTREVTKLCLTAIGRSLLDIARTPLYGVALLIVDIAGVILAPFTPLALYDLRSLSGKLVRSLERGSEDTLFATCFQVRGKLTKLRQSVTVHADTAYPQEMTAGQKAMIHFARASILNLFNAD